MEQEPKSKDHNNGSLKKQVSLSQFFEKKHGHFAKKRKQTPNVQSTRKRINPKQTSSTTRPSTLTRSRIPKSDTLMTPIQSIYSTAEKKSQAQVQQGTKFARSSLHNRDKKGSVSNQASDLDRKHPGPEVKNPSFYCTKTGVEKLDFSQESKQTTTRCSPENINKTRQCYCDTNPSLSCPRCTETEMCDQHTGIHCSSCGVWFHCACIGWTISKETNKATSTFSNAEINFEEGAAWYCIRCRE